MKFLIILLILFIFNNISNMENNKLNFSDDNIFNKSKKSNKNIQIKIKEDKKKENEEHNKIYYLNTIYTSYCNFQKIRYQSQNVLFNSIISILKKYPNFRTENENEIILKYFITLTEFYNIIKKAYLENTNNHLLKIINFISYNYFPKNRLVLRYGEEGRNFFIILNGKIDILIPREKKENLSIIEYYRYLGFLIGYGEKELLNKTINLNYKSYPIEINDIDFGKINIILSSETRKKIKCIDLQTIFSYFTIEEKKNIEKFNFIKFFNNGEIIINYISESEKQKILNSNRYSSNSLISIKLESLKNSIKKIKSKPKSKNSFSEIEKEKNDNIDLSTNDYINRINKYKLKTIKEKERYNTFIIFEYIFIKSLFTGEKFGDFASYDIKGKRTASIITSSECHFGILNKKNFIKYVKFAIDKNQKDYIFFILNSFIFRNFNIEYLHNKLFQSFLINKIQKGNIVLDIGIKNNYLYFLKEGDFEIRMNLKFKEIINVINYYINKLNSLLSNNKIKFKSNLEENIFKHLLTMNQKLINEDKKIESYAKDINAVNIFYNQKFDFKLFTSNSNEIFGFDDLDYENNINLFFIKCISENGEYLKLDKKLYPMFYEVDDSIKIKEYELIKIKIMEIINKLIKIRKIKINTFSEFHNSISHFINFEKEEKDFNNFWENEFKEKAFNHRKKKIKNTQNKISQCNSYSHNEKKFFNYFSKEKEKSESNEKEIEKSDKKEKNLFTSKLRIFEDKIPKNNIYSSSKMLTSNFHCYMKNNNINKLKLNLNKNYSQKRGIIYSNQNKNFLNSISNSNINKDNNNNNFFSYFSISSCDNHITKDNSNENLETINQKVPIKLINQKNSFLKKNKYDKIPSTNNKQLIKNKNKKITLFNNNNSNLQNINNISFSADMKRSFDSISKKFEKKIKLIDIEKNIEKNRIKYMSYREKYNIKKTRDIFLRFKSKIDLKIFKMKE